MPEGDSIYLLAAKLSRVLVGKKIRAFESQTFSDDVARSLVGVTVREVASRGKNLLVRFEDGRALHLHLKMLGRVYVLDPIAFARKSALRRTRATRELRIDVDGAIVLGSHLPVLRLVKKDGEARAPGLASLGPDLLAKDFGEASEREILGRLRQIGDRDHPEIGDAIMQQSAVAGIGNVYKSEVLFIEKINPRARVSDLDDEKLLAIVRRARKLLLANVGRAGRRVTRSTIGEPHYVYLRAGKRCFSCRGAIEMIHQGSPPGRSTYFCASCQRRAEP